MHYLLPILVSGFLLLSMSLAYAQVSASISLDKSIYNVGEKATISGHVSLIGTSKLGVVKVYDSENKLFHLFQITISSDGSFTYIFIVGPNPVNGKYTTTLDYNGQTAQTSFSVTGGRNPVIVTPVVNVTSNTNTDTNANATSTPEFPIASIALVGGIALTIILMRQKFSVSPAH